MRYYSTQRPIAPGTFPRQDGTETITNFDGPTYCEEIGREAWGYIEYEQPLSEKEAASFELIREQRLDFSERYIEPFPVWWTVKMEKKQIRPLAKIRVSDKIGV